MENEIKNRNYIVDNFNDWVTVHYHDVFRSQVAYSIIDTINETEKGRRLRDLIHQFNLIQPKSKKGT
jgi:xanthine dehydrogenase molybdopterin-binding subunit B